MTKIPQLRQGQRLPGPERERIGADLLRRYEAGDSIRQICQQTGYSIGRVRRLLIEAGVKFRTRGGPTRASQSATAQPARSGQ